jgi:hypothetical protein
MAVDQAVARIGLIAEAIAAQRLGNHGQLTPWHVQFDSADGSGRPRIGGRELSVDPLYAGLYRARSWNSLTIPRRIRPAWKCMPWAASCLRPSPVARPFRR